jgi:hypothetical protein
MNDRKFSIIVMVVFVATSVLFVNCGKEPKKEAIPLEISFERNDSTLISNFKITCKDVSETDKMDIINSISFIPSFEYEAEWELDTLTIKPKPKVILEELTKYQLHIGDDKSAEKQNFTFTTGPYSYLTTDLIIKPQYWLKSSTTFRLNADGILETYYSGGIGWQRNFVNSAQFALFCYEDYIRNKNNESERLFWEQIKFFCSNYNEIDNMIAYPYDFPYVGLAAGWYSGMAQGHALNLLIRAFILSDDDYYLNLAQKVVDFMFISVDEGGVFRYTPEGYEWIEEYPTNPPSYVWNGFVFAVMGLIDFNKICPSERLSQHIEQCIIAIKNTIDIYDIGSQLHYGRDTWNGLCDLRYKGIQTHQCKHIYNATKDPFFYNLYLKWFQYFDYNAFINIYN